MGWETPGVSRHEILGKVENLETAAEATERRSAEAQKRRALELWMPPKAKQPLPITGVLGLREVEGPYDMTKRKNIRKHFRRDDDMG